MTTRPLRHADDRDASKIGLAIERLRAFEPPEGYWLAFSGGKDSQAIYHLAVEAGVRFEAHYNITTVDPPELMQFIKGQYPEVQRDHPRMTMWQLIASQSMPPGRFRRYCCRHLKERGGTGRVVVTGVRWAESYRRRERRSVAELQPKRGEVIALSDNETDRRMVEHCPRKGRIVINPILDWTDAEVWTFIRSRGLRYCSLYDEGIQRIGCIACPMQNPPRMREQLRRWPNYRASYVRAFDAMLRRRTERGLETTWRTGEQVMEWWAGPEPTYPLWANAP